MKKLFTLILIALLALPTMNVLGQTPPPMPTGGEKQLNLTVFLQGFYNGSEMTQCLLDDGATPKFSGTIVDTITVELHNSADYTIIEYSACGVELQTNGTANSPGKTYIGVPKTFNGLYYITVKTRNHIETTTAAPVDFSSTISKYVNYDFSTSPDKAYGYYPGIYESMIQPFGTGTAYCLYAGDITQDGLVDFDDISIANDDFYLSIVGYDVADINGDGMVDISDRSIANDNFYLSAQKITP
ncbi:MAG: hypothetical protein HXX18_12430 [Bacteroidetes bacterium]|nr:hypothetical protein [Bacteroidota bacterium]